MEKQRCRWRLGPCRELPGMLKWEQLIIESWLVIIGVYCATIVEIPIHSEGFSNMSWHCWNWHGSKFHTPTNWRAKKHGPLVGPSSSHSQDAEVVCSFTECWYCRPLIGTADGYHYQHGRHATTTCPYTWAYIGINKSSWYTPEISLLPAFQPVFLSSVRLFRLCRDEFLQNQDDKRWLERSGEILSKMPWASGAKALPESAGRRGLQGAPQCFQRLHSFRGAALEPQLDHRKRCRNASHSRAWKLDFQVFSSFLAESRAQQLQLCIKLYRRSEDQVSSTNLWPRGSAALLQLQVHQRLPDAYTLPGGWKGEQRFPRELGPLEQQ